MRDGSPRLLTAYAAAVARIAKAPTRVKPRTGWRSQEPDPEARTIADVRSGRLDFALVSARALDTLGVDAFAPMLAPLAVDSLEAERRVLESELAERALAAVSGSASWACGPAGDPATSARDHPAAAAARGLRRRLHRRPPLGLGQADVRAAGCLGRIHDRRRRLQRLRRHRGRPREPGERASRRRRHVAGRRPYAVAAHGGAHRESAGVGAAGPGAAGRAACRRSRGTAGSDREAAHR